MPLVRLKGLTTGNSIIKLPDINVTKLPDINSKPPFFKTKQRQSKAG